MHPSVQTDWGHQLDRKQTKTVWPSIEITKITQANLDPIWQRIRPVEFPV